MKKCLYCGKAVEDNATVCNHCFAEIPHDNENNGTENLRKTKKKIKE